MKKISVTPKASRLIENLTHIGYSFEVAIADLIDNSIQAGASHIHLDILSEDHGEEPCLIICDNGKGMNFDELKNAMTFGSEKDHTEKNLGKFGLGLKTASLSQSRVLTVFSKPRSESNTKPRMNILEWDMTYVYTDNKWQVLNPSFADLDSWKKDIFNRYEHELNDGGTLIIWSDMHEFIPNLYSTDKSIRDRFFSNTIDKIKKHIGVVFHRFIQGSVPEKKKINIFFDHNKIEGIDPFCKDERSLQQLNKKNIFVEYTENGEKRKSKVIFSPYVLPREDQFLSREAYVKSASWGTWFSTQGFYFYRNNRLLRYGDWSGIVTKDKKNILLRVAVDFNEQLDKAFQINISKEKASIPQGMRSELILSLEEWIGKARKRWNGKKKDAEQLELQKIYKEKDFSSIKFKISSGNKIRCKRSGKNKSIVIEIPKDHDLSEFLEKRKGKENKLKDFSYKLLAILESVILKRLEIKHIPMEEIYEQFKEIK